MNCRIDALPAFINAETVQNFISEGPIHYGQYRFGYCHWVELAGDDSPGEAYSGGFLPYSAKPGDPRHLFYMARSIRVSLPELTIDKKRRYDHRAWQAFDLERRVLPKAEFMDKFGKTGLTSAFCWMKNRFGEAYLQPERLQYILEKPFLTGIMVWTQKDHLTAFALIAQGDWGAHYWYVFYQNDPGLETAPGHGYLLDFLEWARGEHLPHAYLGTGYGKKSRYKSRGLSGIEWWEGGNWNKEKEKLVRFQEADDRQTARQP